jgi:hypothetical protein
LSVSARRFLAGSVATAFLCVAGFAIEPVTAPPAVVLYQQLRAFELSGKHIHAEHLSMNRDRMKLDWSGDFFLQTSALGKVYGAVFLGRGHIFVEPTSTFEKASVRRFLNTDQVDENFTAAVLRFTDDTYDLIASLPQSQGGTLQEAQKLASALDSHIVRETGLNLSARVASAISNNDVPGLFFAEFSGGKRGRFSALIDRQMSSLQGAFGMNGGEKGVLFKYQDGTGSTDIWTAFYSEEDFRNGRVAYADTANLVSIPDYRMQVDLREADHWLKATMELDFVGLKNGIQMIPLKLNEALGADYDARLKKGMHVESATLGDGAPVSFIQDPWEGGFSLILPHVIDVGQKLTVKLRLVGEHSFMTWTDFHYPLSTETWFPRHGYLQRSRFHVVFLHKSKTLVISIGDRVREEPAPDGKGMLTEWITQDAVALDSFAVGPFERHTDTVKVGERKVPIEFYSLPSGYAPIKEDFVVAELMNGINYFSHLFGDYPYNRLGAVFFPSNFGQGFPTMLLLPVQGRSSLREFSFISHEISHQWWGDQVLWRSYRDQWLSEGFAEYSAALYSSRRENPKRALDLVKDMRRELQAPPENDTGIGAGKLYEVGPLIMGHRLDSRRSAGAYTALVYGKGALTLRMLHFLFSNPVDGNDDAFFKMMKDFVEQNRNGSASTENFFALASQRFAQTPIARKYGLTDLVWFLQQWVYGTAMPTYRLEYHFERRPEGGVFLLGTLFQEGVPDDWIMPIPLFMDYGGGKGARGTILARGPKSEIKIGLPGEPRQASLDPDLWVLSTNSTESRYKH